MNNIKLNKEEYKEKVSSFVTLAFSKAKDISLAKEVMIRDFYYDLKNYEFEPEKLFERFKKVTPLEEEVLGTLGLKDAFVAAKNYLESILKGS